LKAAMFSYIVKVVCRSALLWLCHCVSSSLEEAVSQFVQLWQEVNRPILQIHTTYSFVHTQPDPHTHCIGIVDPSEFISHSTSGESPTSAIKWGNHWRVCHPQQLHKHGTISLGCSCRSNRKHKQWHGHVCNLHNDQCLHSYLQVHDDDPEWNFPILCQFAT
jgi:hypothetical protein